MMSGMTIGTTQLMSVAKVTVSIDKTLAAKVDRLVAANVFPNRSSRIGRVSLEEVEMVIVCLNEIIGRWPDIYLKEISRPEA